jgi:hypothetical protein
VRHNQPFLAGRTLDLVPGPGLITRDMLPAVRAGEFYVGHTCSCCLTSDPDTAGTTFKTKADLVT